MGRGRRTLVRDLAVIFAIKVALLVCGYWFFFGPEQRLDVTPSRFIEHLAPADPQGIEAHP